MVQNFHIDAAFPGGNILVEEVKGNEIYLRQDVRDTTTFWFYWAFYVNGAQGQKLTFHFTGGDVLGVRGPAISDDGGTSWQWLGDDSVQRDSKEDVTFSYTFSPEQTKVLFAFCPIYTQRHFDAFLSEGDKSTFIRNDVLCKSRKGRDVELVRLGNPSAAIKVLLTCRHHCCEAAASSVLEGIIETITGQDESGGWLRDHVDWAIIPFVDKDGVEEGDQGKNRAPHDHNRDYNGDFSDSIYPEIAALRQLVTSWQREGNNCAVLDLHCPHIRGNANEYVYFVGVPDQQVWQEVNELSAIWETLPTEAIPYYKSNNLPFGELWNTGGNYDAGKSCTKWASELPHVKLSSALEMPYANASGAEVLPESSRDLGRSLAEALCKYLMGK